MENTQYPIQIIWAGKPYPLDYPAVSTFNRLVEESKKYKNMAVLTGYEIYLSKSLKRMSDVWLNNPRVPREASGTSGMTAAMNGSVNFSTDDGWVPEFAKPGENSFVVPKADYNNMSTYDQDLYDLNTLYDLLENEILPTYYDRPDEWRKIAQRGWKMYVTLLQVTVWQTNITRKCIIKISDFIGCQACKAYENNQCKQKQTAGSSLFPLYRC